MSEVPLLNTSYTTDLSSEYFSFLSRYNASTDQLEGLLHASERMETTCDPDGV